LVLPLLNSISIAKCEVLSTHQGLLVTWLDFSGPHEVLVWA
jgi:hypothetical protein